MNGYRTSLAIDLMIVDDLLDTYRAGDSYHTRRRLVSIIGSHSNLAGTDLQRGNDTIRVNSSHRLVAAAPSKTKVFRYDNFCFMPKKL